jgi:hypothetical protein
MVTFPRAVPTLVVAPGEAAAVAFPDCPGAVEGDAPAEAPAEAEAAAADGAGASEDRDAADAADADSAEADRDWLAEQPTTARAARTAQAGGTLTLH